MRISGFGIISFLVIMLYSCKSSRQIMREDLSEKIRTELGKQQGVFAVAFKDLSSGEELLINERESFHAASTMKTPVMIEVYRQAAQGKFSLDDAITIKNQFKSIVDGSPFSLDSADDSEHSLYTMIGSQKKLSELVYDMIIVSSNLATNIIIELVDAKNVNAGMRELGAKDIQVLRGVEDSKAFQKGLNNSVTAYDLMLIFTKMAKGETVNAEASQKMITVLMDQRFNDIIPALLPKNVKVAHKTGNITGVHHDSGIIFLPSGKKYVLVLLSKELKDTKAATAAMARVSAMLYEHVAGTGK
jgi:beta-lactamase class A